MQMMSSNRRAWLSTVGQLSLGAMTANCLSPGVRTTLADESTSDSLPMQLYKSLNDEQRSLVCLPANDARRQFVSNWWYIHPDHRIPSTFNADQQSLIKQIFDSMHSAEHQAAVNEQVLLDQYGDAKNAPAAGFFGTPDDKDFEFIFTGHHVTRRCNAHTDQGRGFGGYPIFYGHYPHPLREMSKNFNEAPEHPGNPYWYQGRLFNKFVQSLDAAEQSKGLVRAEPRGEQPAVVIQKPAEPKGLNCGELSGDHKRLLLDTMRGMLAMFRPADVVATMDSITTRNIIERLHISWYTGKYDIGSDHQWDTWQIEGPDLVWYFRGYPHIHCYFHLNV
jgi:hypothetical protein